MFRKRPVIKLIPTPTYVKYASFIYPAAFVMLRLRKEHPAR